MAKATVVREQPVQPPVEKVVLELSEKEAQTLLDFLYNGNWPYAPVAPGAAAILHEIGVAFRQAGFVGKDWK